MLIEILKHTPPWVFALFFVLVTFGYLHSTERMVSRNAIALLPAIMIALSFYGVLSSFGMTLLGLAAWTIGVAFAVGLGTKLATPRGVTFSAETQAYCVPGSWLPLALMLAIYFTKYAVGVVVARQLPVANEPTFIGASGLCYGFLSGIFLARAIAIRRSAKLTK